MTLGRRALVLVLSLGMALGSSDGVSAALCRILCDLGTCRAAAPENGGETDEETGDCCREDEAQAGPAYEVAGEGSSGCPCAEEAPARGSPQNATTPSVASCELLLPAAWLWERWPWSRWTDDIHAHARCASPVGSALAPGGPPGGASHVALGGRWSTAVLGCARI